MTDFSTTALHLAGIASRKNTAYGDSVGSSARMLQLLYPNGLRPDQYLDAIVAARIFDKQSRLAQLSPDAADAHGEDPRLDIAGYALLALHLATAEHERTTAPCHDSASDPTATSPSRVPLDSAEGSTSSPTTATKSAISASMRSPWPSAFFASTSVPASTSPDSAPACTAPATASASAAVPAVQLLNARAANGWWAALGVALGWLLRDFCFNVPPSPIALAGVVLCGAMLLFLQPLKPQPRLPHRSFFDQEPE